MLFDAYGDYLNCLWQNLPAEIRSVDKRRWLLAREDKRPLSVSKQGALYSASVTNPGHCLFFEDALKYAMSFSQSYDCTYYVGRALFAEDNLTVIDLDRKDPLITPEQIDLQDRFLANYQTFAEFSISGKGAHIWALGSIGPGVRRDSIEIYSQERFIICTGWAVPNRNIPLANCQEMLVNSASQMRLLGHNSGQAGNTGDYVKNTIQPSQSDEEIFNRLCTAANADKFLMLWNDDGWRELPEFQGKSASEADLALLTFLVFYTDSDDQILRMHRLSKLAHTQRKQPQKVFKDDKYLLRTLGQARNPINNEPPKVEIDVDALLQSATKKANGHFNGHDLNGHDALADYKEPPIDDYRITFPPGWAGAIAQAIQASSKNLLPEAAICSALGMLAGVCGLSWNINGSGLNHYLIFVGLSGIGKETLMSGPNNLIKACNLKEFVHKVEVRSGQALGGYILEGNQSFAHFQREIGSKLARYGNSSSNLADQAYGDALLSYYDAANRDSIEATRIIYAKQIDSRRGDFERFNYTLVGETTPDFYNNIPDEMLSNGLMSRMNIIESDATVPIKNPNITAPHPDLITHLTNLGNLSRHYQRNKIVHEAQLNDEALELSEAFDQYCKSNLGRSKDNSIRHIYSRAHLKALRTSGLLAVVDNPITPVVNADHWRWVEVHVRHNMNIFLRKFEDGSIGQDDNARRSQLISTMAKYLSHGASRKLPQQEINLLENQIILHSRFVSDTRNLASFIKYKGGSNQALTHGLVSLVEMGYIYEVKNPKERDAFKLRANSKAYRILKVT